MRYLQIRREQVGAVDFAMAMRSVPQLRTAAAAVTASASDRDTRPGARVRSAKILSASDSRARACTRSDTLLSLAYGSHFEKEARCRSRSGRFEQEKAAFAARGGSVRCGGP
jgi:hypothetical protein